MPARRLTRRAALALFAAPSAGGAAVAAEDPAGDPAWAALRQGGIALFRHAQAPGGGDPPGMRLGACETQRNLDETGRAQARRIGAEFRRRGIAVGAVLTSAWCRAQETAELAFPGAVRPEPAFDSFFGNRAAEPEHTAAARRILLAWEGPGALLATTHQVNITALTGLFPASGEAIVLQRQDGALAVVGRIRP
ncbi:histidine phosphatase family protein [Falsiroseomonas tokyonensis]|uniref:Histidine phosphatase family protein n=1 Tax=Falsiroseomonas tokyonensis TaxID=430521 RepID=A0ABV7C4K0_9PROT|nr:histidine phosphatase family protein [Falsiroseomonas tokyonensis]MBU8541077.1 histidine phosphatase family protein [Falsiroseomonas tokyonensis]